jgi:5-methylcytosine-specific restriction endonuclease McrA
MNSREYAKFKRLFVGPIMPRRIIKERYYSVGPSKANPRPALKKNDIRKLWDGAAMRRYATPKWANKTSINDLYEQSRKLTKKTGIKHEVDHIIPIKHPLVCGLHTESNLRIILASENNKKSNFFD